ncbi:hypothetical protein HPODL_05273 [Ogataea parapolymorpha DL-1]|uniref:Zinc-ribbon 15 domain-containing protein n=1 Tax=Ogataea parapolymorpha (strain ATCC 26012 / BCRC 20466 / JCM 22074 / NRRL Y-7560 / DL-1) TaxID=871575 RepID=W1QEB8_OGAPD|nr:hypothetical protein HPODL_05273 [Ogataea parapolymorpha DL-1]ESW98894.1 hypothetical protein HPODL_05273 [Ogataea parapolymorpha DL-1]
MFFFFLFGAKSFKKELKQYDGKRVYCPRCHNISMQYVRNWNFITVFFVPIIPFSFYKELYCPICGNHTMDANIV